MGSLMINTTKYIIPENFDESKLKELGIVKWEPTYTELLDHGYIGLVDYMGSDNMIADAARTSYQKGTKQVSNNKNLLRYLMRHQHMTPFEMCEFTFHMKMPIFVMRQLVRHRTAQINEQSARYSIIEDDFYIPTYDKAASQSEKNNQGRSEIVLNENDYIAVTSVMDHAFNEAYISYKHLLGPVIETDDKGNTKIGNVPNPPDQIQNRKLWLEDCAVKALSKLRTENPDKVFTEQDIENKIKEYFEANEMAIVGPEFNGLARELARIVLPVATYTQLYWKCDLRNIFNFIRLRNDSHAQYEIRVYAQAMYDMIKEIVPLACDAFDDYVMNAKTYSRIENEIIKELIKNSDIETITKSFKNMGLSKREIEEFFNKTK